jgi:ferritin-like metal-binding protein YciE
MPEVQSLRSHLLTELRDLLDAEQQLAKVLPDMASGATTPALRLAFKHHLGETEGHIHRLKEAFGALSESAQSKRCEAMQGLIREGNSVMNSTPPGALRDAVMITAAQKVEHYEMASYGTARAYAQVLGHPEVARLLQETLDEEKAADAKLTTIAEGKVNEKAAEEWHQDQAAAGLLEHTAAFAGQAVGMGALTIKRAAEAIGFGKGQSGASASVASASSRTAAVAHETHPARKRSATPSARKQRTTASARPRGTTTRTRKSTGR